MADNDNTTDISQLVKDHKSKNKAVAYEQKELDKIIASYEKKKKVIKETLDLQEKQVDIQKVYSKEEDRLLKKVKEQEDVMETVKKIEKEMLFLRNRDNKAYRQKEVMLNKLKATQEKLNDQAKDSLQKIVSLEKDYGKEIKKRNKDAGKVVDNLLERESILKRTANGLKKLQGGVSKGASAVDNYVGSSIASLTTMSGLIKLIFGELDASMKMSAKLSLARGTKTLDAFEDMVQKNKGKGTLSIIDDAGKNWKKQIHDLNVMADSWGMAREKARAYVVEIQKYSSDKTTLKSLIDSVSYAKGMSLAMGTSTDNVMAYRKTMIKTLGMTRKDYKRTLTEATTSMMKLNKEFDVATHTGDDYVKVIMDVATAMKSYGLSTSTARKMTDHFVSTFKEAGYTVDQAIEKSKKFTKFFSGGGGQKWEKYLMGKDMEKMMGVGELNKMVLQGRKGGTSDADISKQLQQKLFERTYGKYMNIKDYDKLEKTQKDHLKKQATLIMDTANVGGSYSQTMALEDVTKGSEASIMAKAAMMEKIGKLGGREGIATLKSTIGKDLGYAEIARYVAKYQSDGGGNISALVNEIKKGQEKAKATKEAEKGLTNKNFETYMKKNQDALKNVSKKAEGLASVIRDEITKIVDSIVNLADKVGGIWTAVKWIGGTLLAIKALVAVGGALGGAKGALGGALKGALRGGKAFAGSAFGKLALSFTAGAALGTVLYKNVSFVKRFGDFLGSSTAKLFSFNKVVGMSEAQFRKQTKAQQRAFDNIYGKKGSAKEAEMKYTGRMLTAVIKKTIENQYGGKATKENIKKARDAVIEKHLTGTSLKQQMVSLGLSRNDVLGEKSAFKMSSSAGKQLASIFSTGNSRIATSHYTKLNQLENKKYTKEDYYKKLKREGMSDMMARIQSEGATEDMLKSFSLKGQYMSGIDDLSKAVRSPASKGFSGGGKVTSKVRESVNPATGVKTQYITKTKTTTETRTVENNGESVKAIVASTPNLGRSGSEN